MSAKILVVDDEAEARRNLQELLSGLGHRCEEASDGLEAMNRLKSWIFDIVLADIRMPGLDGFGLLREIHKHYRGIDVIMMTGYGMEFSYVDVIQAGAADFIVKPFTRDELTAKINRVLRERALKVELLHLSIHDALTDLFNRRHFFERLETELRRAQRQRHELCFVMLDVDRFKEYNDTHGHLEGDRLLVKLSRVLSHSIRQNVDVACRYGGDEFGVLLAETPIAQGCRVAERIRSSFLDQDVGHCTLSIGVAPLSSQGSFDELIRWADDAMYEAKRAGGNQVRFSDQDKRMDFHDASDIAQTCPLSLV